MPIIYHDRSRPIYGAGLLKPGVGTMATTAHAPDLDHSGNLLDDQIKAARLAHAEKLTAAVNIHDASILRLQVLKDDLAPIFARNAAARRVVDLTLVPGDPPRLWIDMTSYVTMEPDPSTYRLQRDSFCRRELLLESKNRGDVIAAITGHVASHLVEREKQLTLVMSGDMPGRGVAMSKTSLVLAWLAGLTLGISTMAAVVMFTAR
jgi:hypothetical protein